jgi:hypothetical protein
MKHFRTSAVILALLAPLVMVRGGEAATYEWTDDGGVVHFTDDQDKIPAKFRKRVKELNIGSDQNVISPAVPAAESSPPPVPPERKITLSEGYWRSKFTNLRKEIKAQEESLSAMKEQELVLNRKRIVYGRTSDRIARNNMVESIAKVEERIRALQEELKTLDKEASDAGVPSEWRQ